MNLITKNEENEIIEKLNHERNLIKKAVERNELDDNDLHNLEFDYENKILKPKNTKFLKHKNTKSTIKNKRSKEKIDQKQMLKKKKILNKNQVNIFDKLYNEKKEKDLKKEYDLIENLNNNDIVQYNNFENKYCDLKGNIEKDVVNRLYADAIEKQKKIKINEKLKEEKEIEEIRNVSKPHKSKYNKNEVPIYERYQIEKQKIENKRKDLIIKKEIEECNNYFKPQISVISNVIVKNKYKNKNYFERIKNYSEEKKDKRIKLLEKNQKDLEMNYPFKPDIVTIYQDKNFLERQEDYLNKLKEKRMELEKNEKLSFKPEINKISSVIALNSKDLEAKFNKLSIQDAEKKKMLISELKKEKESKLTFKPKINKNSLKIAKEKEFIYDKNKFNDKINKIKYENLIKEQEICTFKPNTNKNKYKNISSNIYNYNEEYTNKKKIQKEIVKKQVEYDEFKECSFKPKINNFIKKPKKSEINGFNEHLEKMEKIKKKIEIQKKYEDEKFNMQKNYCYNKHIDATEPLPFKLSKNNKVKNYDYIKDNKEKNDNLNYISLEQENTKIARELINLI